MPDWIIHMGAARALARPPAKWDARWLLFGAVLPDAIPRAAANAVDLLAGELGPPAVHVYVSLLHTPFSVALLGAALVVLASDRVAAWRGLAFGAALHFALDVLQKSYGGGSSLAYPIDLRAMTLQVAWYENPVTFALVPAGAVYLVVSLLRGGVTNSPPFRRPGPGLLAWAAALVATCLLVPLACLERAMTINLNNARFATEPEAWEGCPVLIGGARVHELDERHLCLELMDCIVPIARAGVPEDAYGRVVSLRGVFHAGQVRAEAVFVHDYAYKKLVSLIGALLLLGSWVPGLRQQLRARRARLTT